MDFKALVQESRESGDYRPVIDSIPYARTIGLDYQQFGEDLLFVLPARDSNLGNPILPAIHGGVIGGAMELAAALFVIIKVDCIKMPKIVDFSIDYLRAGFNKCTYIECRVTRQGRRVANVIVHAWQSSREEPIALARAHFLIN